MATASPVLNRLAHAALCSLALAAPTAWSQALEGRFVQLQGDVRVDGRAAAADRTLKGATVQTGADGRAQIRMSDGSLLAIAPGSQLKLAADAPAVALVFGSSLMKPVSLCILLGALPRYRRWNPN